MFITWLPAVLRARGLAAVEQPGWETRGRAWPAQPQGVVCHHTAGPKTGNAPSLHLVENGRPDLAGPLSQLVLGRDGTFFVVAAGRSNHAGAGIWMGVTTGNSSFIGIEAENAGTPDDPWPAVQTEAYAQGVAAILEHLGKDENWVCGHKEYARPKGRKVDPSFDMLNFRAAVRSALSGNRMSAFHVHTVDVHHAMLRKGDRGPDVVLLQQRLGGGLPADGAFGVATEVAVENFQRDHGLQVDGHVGPKTWAVLDPAPAP